MDTHVDRAGADLTEAWPQTTLLRYNNGAVLLHWLTALLVITQVVVGFTFFSMARGPTRAELFTVHKTIGATILLLALIRLGWRLAHRPPPFPPELPRWERIAAVWNHRLFYVLLFALPITGLLAVSASAGGKHLTRLLGGIPLPLIPGIPKSSGEGLGDFHDILVIVTLALVVLHVGAAFKHQFERNRAAGRMPPFTAQGERAMPVS